MQDQVDEIFTEFRKEDMIVEGEDGLEIEQVVEVDSFQTTQMKSMRDELATSMWNDYQRRNRRRTLCRFIMGTETIIKELRQALQFVLSIEFWRMAIFWTISLLASYLQLCNRLFSSQKTISYARCPPPVFGSARPVCVITGVTSGLGKAAARALSKEGFNVVLVGRSSHFLSKIVEEISFENEEAQHKAFQVDISSFQSLLDFRDSLQQWLLNSNMHFSVQLLVNNAGILATSSQLSPEGNEQMMSTNYIGPFCLTMLMMPLLKRSRVPACIVNVTSFTHRSASCAQFDKESVSGRRFLQEETYPCAQVYEYSKLCLLLFTYKLHGRLSGTDRSHHISVIAADPGMVETNIMRELPPFISCAAFFVFRILGLLQSPEEGISSILDAALAPSETSGLYFFGGKGRTIVSSIASRSAKNAEELWATSCDLFSELQLVSKTTS